MKYLFLIISISLAATFYCFSEKAVLDGKGKFLDYKIKTFTSFCTGGLENHIKQVYPPWRGRLFSALAGNGFMKAAGLSNKTDLKQFAKIIAGYNALWFIGCIVLIFLFSKNRLFFLFGMFACTCYAWTPVAENLICPWDMPMLFFWTLILFMAEPKYKNALPFIIAFAMGFKETVILLSIIPMFWKDLSFKERINRTLTALVLCFVVKFILDLIVQNPVPFFTMQTQYEHLNKSGHLLLIDQNFWLLSKIQINHVIFSAGGIATAIFLLPKQANMEKIIAVTYIPFMMFFCVISEARLFNEFIPLFFIGMDRVNEK